MHVAWQHTVSPTEPEDDGSGKQADIKLTLISISRAHAAFIYLASLLIHILHAPNFSSFCVHLCLLSSLLAALLFISTLRAGKKKTQTPFMCTLFLFTYFFLLLFIPLLPFVHKQPTLFFCHHSAFLSLSYMPTILPSLSFVCLSSSPQLLSLSGLIPRKAIMQYARIF